MFGNLKLASTVKMKARGRSSSQPRNTWREQLCWDFSSRRQTRVCQNIMQSREKMLTNTPSIVKPRLHELIQLPFPERKRRRKWKAVFYNLLQNSTSQYNHHYNFKSTTSTNSTSTIDNFKSSKESSLNLKLFSKTVFAIALPVSKCFHVIKENLLRLFMKTFCAVRWKNLENSSHHVH